MSEVLEKKAEVVGNVRTLCAAAAAMSCLANPSSLVAETAIKAPEFRLQYSSYLDWQEGKKERMTVRAPMAWVKSALTERDELEASFVLDTMSGASVLYHDALTGASEKGIEDERKAGDLTLTHFFERFALAAGINYSNEDDYLSRGLNLSGRTWSLDKLSTLSAGVGSNLNEISSTNDDQLHESSRDFHYLIGATQILNKVSLVQSNLTFEHNNGYLDDAYKSAENRPRARDALAWLTRYVHYIDWSDASLHADYRLYADSWGINSHTLEVSWYQPLGDDGKWLLRPRLRYYTQSQAEFYSDFFPPQQDESHYTADSRLSAFGDITTGLRLSREFNGDFTLSFAVDLSYTDGALRSFGQGSPGIDNQSSSVYSFALFKRFS